MKPNHSILVIYLICFMFGQAFAQKTLGEENSTYTYIPFDPLPVSTLPGDSCKSCKECQDCDSIPFKLLQNSFPDITVRLSIEKITNGASGGFGNYFTAKKKGETYKVILDYIHADVSRIPFLLKSEKKKIKVKGKDEEKTIYKILPAVTFVKSNDVKINYKVEDFNIKENQDGEIVTVPVYVGIGLRIIANVTTVKKNAKLSGLSIIAGEVSKGRLKGNLTVQTLGITGEKILLPLPSEINQTTIQNALIAIGSLRSLIYDDSTEITPRVVGIYKPFKGGEQVVNDIISYLARDRVIWYRPCNSHATCKGNKKNK